MSPKRNPQSSKPTTTPANTSHKRKSPPELETSSLPPTKSARKKTPSTAGTRSSTRNKSKSKSKSTGNTTPKALLTYLLSPSCLQYCFPTDELSFHSESPHPNPVTYSTTPLPEYTPFQHLLLSSLLSKPLSHRLSLRSIRTLCNAPYNLTSTSSILEAGAEKVWEALEVTRTQHRQKTAGYVFGMAETIEKEGWGDDLAGLLAKQAKGDGGGKGYEGIRKILKAKIKGLGDTGVDIFFRRAQVLWPDFGWFADRKSLDAVRTLFSGTEVGDAEGLRGVMEESLDWGQLTDVMGSDATGGVESVGARVAFVLVLERALGCVLEGKGDELVKAAGGDAAAGGGGG